MPAKNCPNYCYEKSAENTSAYQFRARRELLGDIIHSTLYYWKHATGVEQLYVGANDGMLHVFDAQTGQEVFAYIPSLLIPKLKNLVADPYTHTAFVDGPLNMARVTLSGTAKTVLVGGLGAGGRGLFALDVTDPTPADETAAAGKILWEIAATGDFANLGYTYAMPRIARLNNGTAAAIVGNGYMNGGNGHSVLYIINLETGAPAILILAISPVLDYEGAGSRGGEGSSRTGTTRPGSKLRSMKVSKSSQLSKHR